VKARPSTEEIICISLILFFSALLILHPGTLPFAFGVGVGCIFLALGAFLKPADRRELIAIGLLFPPALVGIRLGNNLVVRMTSGTIDDTLLRLEHGVSVTMYHWVLAHHFCCLFLAAVYCALPVAEALVLIVSARRLACLASIVLAGLFAPIFYMIFPAVGPAWVGVADAPRNCVPSLHLTWALLLILYIPGRLRLLAIIFAVLTACATLGLGQHYIIDLIAAVPYTWAVFLLPFGVRFARRRSSNATYPAEALPGNSLNS